VSRPLPDTGRSRLLTSVRRYDAERRGLVLTAVFVWSWEKGVSPFTFLRNMGPWGPMFAARYTQRRFAAQSEEDRQDIHSYIYNTSILKGSGEFCICESHTSIKVTVKLTRSTPARAGRVRQDPDRGPYRQGAGARDVHV